MVYPLVMTNIAIENCHLWWVYPLKMVIFHSKLLNYQRVSPFPHSVLLLWGAVELTIPLWDARHFFNDGDIYPLITETALPIQPHVLWSYIYIYTYIPWKITHLWMIFPLKLPCIINFPIFSYGCSYMVQGFSHIFASWMAEFCPSHGPMLAQSPPGLGRWDHLPCIWNSLELESLILYGICYILVLQPFMWLSWEFL